MQLTDHIINFTQLPLTLTLALFTALLSLFLEFCFREGKIFSGWLDFWADNWLRANFPAIFQEIEMKTDDDIKLMTAGKYETAREYKHSEVKWFWWKPLGGCVVCMNVWLCFPFYHVNPFHYLLMILLSNFIVRYFHEKIL